MPSGGFSVTRSVGPPVGQELLVAPIV